MNLQEAFADATLNRSPIDRDSLVKALTTTQQSGLLLSLLRQIRDNVVWAGGVNESEEDIVREVRAARMKLAVIQELTEQLARLVEKESDDA